MPLVFPVLQWWINSLRSLSSRKKSLITRVFLSEYMDFDGVSVVVIVTVLCGSLWIVCFNVLRNSWVFCENDCIYPFCRLFDVTWIICVWIWISGSYTLVINLWYFAVFFRLIVCFASHGWYSLISRNSSTAYAVVPCVDKNEMISEISIVYITIVDRSIFCFVRSSRRHFLVY